MAFPALLAFTLLQSIPGDTAAARTEQGGNLPAELTAEIRDDADGSALVEALDWLRSHPLDLNSITLEDLLSVPCVTISGARALLDFREKLGRFSSPDQLLGIGGEGFALYRALAPFVCASATSPCGSGRRRILFRSRAIGGTPSDESTPGSPLKFSSRIIYEDGRTAEAGAQFVKGAGVRAEDAFMSGYAIVRGVGCVTECIAGDYDLESAQGLVFWRGPSAVRSSWSLRPGAGAAIVPHRSGDESRFLRGLAVAASAGERWRGALFLSDRSYGANVDSTGEATGFFRGEYSTQSSVEKRDRLRERLIGVRCEYAFPGAIGAGCTMYRAFFDRSFTPEDRMRFSGNSLFAAGMDLSARLGILSLAGEYALVGGGSRAWLWSVTLVPAEGRMLMVRSRNYGPGYDNPHASAEGDNAETRNEKGVAALLRLTPFAGSSLECAVDAFEHPWPQTRTPLARRGMDVTLGAETVIAPGEELSLRCSRKSSYDQFAGYDAWGREARSAGVSCGYTLRLNLSCRPDGGLGFSTFLEIAAAHEAGEEVRNGLLIGGEVSCAPVSILSIDARFSLFHTDGYAARVYAFESGLPGLLSVPPLYGHGLRWYVRSRCSPAPWADIVFRYAATVKDPSVSTGTPLYELAGSCAAQIGVQVDIHIP